MSHPNSIIKGYTATAAVAASRIVKYGAADNTVVPGAAATDALVGVSVQTVDADIGEVCDVVKSGPAIVRLGGAVTRGALLTCDASGKAVAAAPAAGANVRVIGVADASGVLDDLIPCTVSLGSLQG